MNRQQAFTQAVEGLHYQGWRQAINDETCAYRVGKLKCALGWLIPDEAYAPALEFVTYEELRKSIPELRELDDTFLAALQQAHDDAETPYNMMKNFMLLAEQYDFEKPAVLVESFTRPPAVI